MKKKAFHIIALCSFGNGISGGDRIYIEFARRLSKKINTYIYCWEEGYEMCKRNELDSEEVNFIVSKLMKYNKFGFLIMYLVRIIEGVKLGLTLKIDSSKINYFYNASEFWMDSIPCILLKIKYPSIIWLASWYQTAPNPVTGFALGERESRYRFTALLYWLSQLPIKPFVSKLADYVFVNNEVEKKYFPEHVKTSKTVVVLGAVDIVKILKWKSKIGKQSKIYDAVFQGRFHAQKGVVELIDIWNKVVEKLPDARLAMIGDGPLRLEVETRIKKYHLNKNIKLFGFVFDGEVKYRIFSQSKIVVHPAFYDSGGMAAAEAMAFEIPAVGFDLESYKSYYPKGMLKAQKSEIQEFADLIVKLLQNDQLRKSKGREAKDSMVKNFSWDKRIDEISAFIGI